MENPEKDQKNRLPLMGSVFLALIVIAVSFDCTHQDDKSYQKGYDDALLSVELMQPGTIQALEDQAMADSVEDFVNHSEIPAPADK